MTPDPSGGVPARRPDPPDPATVPGWRKAWNWWLGKSAVIAGKQNTVFSWLAYYAGLSWVGWWFRVTKQDRLDRATRPVGESGWNEREGPIDTDPRRIRRPF